MKRLLAILLSIAIVFAMVPVFAVSAETAQTKGDEPIRILAIGNSYACNATQYIDRITEDLGLNVEARVLYYPGCSIKQHVEFYRNESEVYALGKNGEEFDWSVRTMKQAFARADYDIITIQEMPSADNFATYWTESEPYLTDLYDIIKENEPQAEIFINQTWSHCAECIKTHYHSKSGNYNNSAENFAAIENAYLQAAEKIGLTENEIIPVGKAVQIAKDDFGFGDFYNTKEDGSSLTVSEHLAGGALYTDPICHLNYRGRYMASCIWVEKLFGVDCRNNTFFPEELDREECQLLEEIAHEVVSGEEYCVDGDWRYMPNGDGVKVMHYLGRVPAHGIIEIPATLGGKQVNAVAKGVFKNHDGIKQLYIPEGELDIEEGALAIDAVNRILVNEMSFDEQKSGFFVGWWDRYYYVEREKNFLIDPNSSTITVLDNGTGKYSSLDHTGNGGNSVVVNKKYLTANKQVKSVMLKISRLFGNDKMYFDETDLGKTYSISAWVYLANSEKGDKETVKYGLAPVAQLATEESVGYGFYGDTYGKSVNVGEWTRISFEVTLDETHIGNNQVGLLCIYLDDSWGQPEDVQPTVMHVDDIRVELIEKGQIPINKGEAVIPKGYDVTYMNGEEVCFKEEYLTEGSTFDINYAVPNTDTHYFAGWFFDKELTQQTRTSILIEGNVTLYAKMLPYKSGVTINSDTNPTSANYWTGWATVKHKLREPVWQGYRGVLGAYGLAGGKYGDTLQEGSAHRHSGFTSSGSTKIGGKEVRDVRKGAVWEWIRRGDYIIRDENGEAFIVKPETTYKVTLTYTNVREADEADTVNATVYLGTGLGAFNLLKSSELKFSDLGEGMAEFPFNDGSEGGLAFFATSEKITLDVTETAKTVELTITTPTLKEYQLNNALQVLSISDKTARGMMMSWESVVVEEVKEETPEYKQGDVDGDGTVNASDLALLKKVVAGFVAYDSEEVKNADVDLSGAVPNAADLALLKKIVAGLV